MSRKKIQKPHDIYIFFLVRKINVLQLAKDLERCTSVVHTLGDLPR